VIADLRHAEDVRLAWTLLAASLATVLFSAPMLRAHFAETIAKARPPVRVPPVPVMFAAEAVKTALVSGFASWAGLYAATRAGLDAPIFRALLRHESATAAAALARALSVGAPLGVAAFAVATGLHRRFDGPPPDRATLPLRVQLTGVFYTAVFLEHWVDWGVLSLAICALSAAGLPRLAAIAVAALVVAVAFGAFASISIRRKHPGEPHALRQGILCYGLPGLLCIVALFAAGLESAMFAHASWVALRILITPRAVSS